MVLALLCISSVVWYSKRPEPWKKINGELEVVGKAIDWGQYTNDLALPPDAIFEPIDPQTRGNSQFQHQLLTAPQFAAEIKHRNPELSSMDDDVLVREVLKRRPEFLKIEGLPPGARPIFDKGGFDFSFTVTNITANDYELRDGQVRLYSVSTKSQALSDEPDAAIRFASDSTGKQPILFPRGRRVRLVIHLNRETTGADAAALYRKEGESTDGAMPRVVTFLHRDTPQFGGFVILDSSRRYEIDLPFAGN